VKTAESIERQESRKEDEKSSDFHANNSVPVSVDRAESRRRQNAAIRPYCFQPGQSGNPGGRPKSILPPELHAHCLNRTPRQSSLHSRRSCAKVARTHFKCYRTVHSEN